QAWTPGRGDSRLKEFLERGCQEKNSPLPPPWGHGCCRLHPVPPQTWRGFGLGYLGSETNPVDGSDSRASCRDGARRVRLRKLRKHSIALAQVPTMIL